MKKIVAALLRKLADKLSKQDIQPERLPKLQASRARIVKETLSVSRELMAYSIEGEGGNTAIKHAKLVIAEDIKERLILEDLISFESKKAVTGRMLVTGTLYVLTKPEKECEWEYPIGAETDDGKACLLEGTKKPCRQEGCKRFQEKRP